ncbi:MAG: hypothetical protein EOR67_10450 [Mesorhizobium sp.]|uniref:hypothetical protein n=1 Tax=Mesorhizobium sp. TaxID=1871066 RepID=UPI000FE5DBB5|nr:hypothetical protein [Mesorhizobium sp.]RWL85394.1 MAG: hypothetical protein EOR69_06545 [Mesorhizobium sp.]RWL89055.1 MAG: hypothetical protein EOR67_10450 [Mesorhizobium sp.]RWM03075.1 MAG: hypothetical protein EOR70_01750 [Mesorhizobium sp.]
MSASFFMVIPLFVCAELSFRADDFQAMSENANRTNQADLMPSAARFITNSYDSRKALDGAVGLALRWAKCMVRQARSLCLNRHADPSYEFSPLASPRRQ